MSDRPKRLAARLLFVFGPAVLFGGIFAAIDWRVGLVCFAAFAGFGWDVTRMPRQEARDEG